MSMAPLRRELEIPQAKEAEEAIIGVCLLNNDLIWDAIELVQPWEFLNSRNRLVFKTMCEMMQAGEGVDPLTLRKKLKDRNGSSREDKLAQEIYHSDLSNFIDRQPRVDFIENYARIVSEAAISRGLQSVGSKLMGLASDPDLTVDDKRERATTMLDAVFGRRDMDGVVNAVTAYDEGMAEIETRRRQIDSGGVRGISTGYTQLDAILGGWQKKTYVLAARPSVGKSALMVNWAVKAVGDGAHAIIFSTEMQRSEIIFRAASFLSGVPSEGFNSGRILPDDFHKLQAAREMLRGFGDRLLIDHRSTPTVSQIRSVCKSRQRRHGLDIVFVDYLQILGCEGRTANDTERVTKISNGLKQAQQELGVPFVVLSQLNRGSAKDKREPELEDLRQSGAIEQDCDVAMLMWPGSDYGDDYHGVKNIQLGIKKHRGGRRGRVSMRFEGKLMEFTEE